MTEARYHELLGRLLDGDPSEAEVEELRRELERDPARLRDLGDHLAFSEILAHELDPGRTPDAFWEGVRSQLNAGPPAGTASRRVRLRLAAGMAACILAAVGIAAFRSRQDAGTVSVRAAGMERVSLRGEIVCAHCILHQTGDCRPVVRVHEADRDETIALSDNAVYRDFYRKQGCGRKPVPVIAEGVMRAEDGHPLLAVTRLEIAH
jgi:hypothetical protein